MMTRLMRVSIDPLVLFSIQFTSALIAYALAARWYVWPRINPLPPTVALVLLVWVHVFRFIGGSILAPGSVGPRRTSGVPRDDRIWGYGHGGARACGADRASERGEPR